MPSFAASLKGELLRTAQREVLGLLVHEYSATQPKAETALVLQILHLRPARFKVHEDFVHRDIEAEADRLIDEMPSLSLRTDKADIGLGLLLTAMMITTRSERSNGPQPCEKLQNRDWMLNSRNGIWNNRRYTIDSSWNDRDFGSQKLPTGQD